MQDTRAETEGAVQAIMAIIELREGRVARTTEKVHDPRYFHSYMADIFAYARRFGLTTGVDCEVVVTSDDDMRPNHTT